MTTHYNPDKLASSHAENQYAVMDSC